MVLLYSARLSRRIVTRAGSGEPLQSTFVSTFSIQAMMNSFSSFVGLGDLDLGGGISPAAMMCCTASQFLRSLRACASLTYPSSIKPPLAFSPLWQSMQYFLRNGSTFVWKVS